MRDWRSLDVINTGLRKGNGQERYISMKSRSLPRKTAETECGGHSDNDLGDSSSNRVSTVDVYPSMRGNKSRNEDRVSIYIYN